MSRSQPIIALCCLLAVRTGAQLTPGETVEVATYHNQLTLEGAGSYQRILYEDAINSTVTTNMIWSEVYVAPCGIGDNLLCMPVTQQLACCR